MEDRLYECPGCGKQERASSPPECCGEPMHVCTTTATAEHSRPMEDEEPCDDFRSG